MEALSVKLIILSCLFIILSQLGVVDPFRTAALSISRPLQYGFLSLGRNLRKEWSFWLNLRGIWQENLHLKEEIENLRVRLSQEKETAWENELLRSQLRLGKATTSRKLLLARVTGRLVGSEGSFLTLDKGKGDGLAVGKAVVFKNFLVGVVVKATEKAAKVRLIVDPQSRIASLDQDSKDRTRGVVRGEFSMSLLMEKVLPGEQISPGDKIVTSGEGGFPKGLLVGEVVGVSSSSADVLKWAKLKPLVDLYSLEKVFVVF